MKGRLLAIAVVGIPGLVLCQLAFNRIKDARAAEPVPMTGTITSFEEHYHGSRGCFECVVPPYDWDAYNVSLRLADGGSFGPFWLHTGEFHPPIPDALKQPGAAATIWYDQGTNDLIGLAEGGHRYSTEYLVHPRAKYWDVVGLGAVIALPDALALLLVLLIGAVSAIRAIGPPRHYHPSALLVTRTSDDEAEAYAYLSFAIYAASAFILVIVASIRWGSMPFWGLLLGSSLSIIVALALGDLIGQPSRWIAGLSMLSLLVVPLVVPVILAFALTYVERHL